MALEHSVNEKSVVDTITSLDTQNNSLLNSSEKSDLIERVVILEQKLKRARAALRNAQSIIIAASDQADSQIDSALKQEREVELVDGEVVRKSQRLEFYGWAGGVFDKLDQAIKRGL